MELPDPVEVDIGTPWRTAKLLISQFVPSPERVPGALLAMAVVAAGAMIATAVYRLDHTIRRVSLPERRPTAAG